MTYAEALTKVRSRHAAELLVLCKLMGFEEPLPPDLIRVTLEEPERKYLPIRWATHRMVRHLTVNNGSGELTDQEWAILMSSQTAAVRETAVRQFHLMAIPCR